MNKFLNRDNLPKLKQKELDNMINLISVKNNKFVGKIIILKKKALGQNSFSGEF